MNKLIVANLKMNLQSPAERERYLNLLKKELKLAGKKIKNSEIIICVPFVHLEGIKNTKIKKIAFGAQNMFWKEKGSYTGEVSPKMLTNLSCDYVIVGHSERKRYFCERDEEINLKIISALKNRIRPILCVGESAQEKEMGMKIVKKQLENCLKDISRAKIEKVIICYEPVWAISSNKPDHLPTTNDVMSAKLFIRKFLVEKYGIKTADKVGIIYGGSVSTKNAKEVCLESGMDGVLIGKESLSPHEFIKIAGIINS